MNGKEIVNLIVKLEQEGMNADKIIEIIKYIETAANPTVSQDDQQ